MKPLTVSAIVIWNTEENEEMCLRKHVKWPSEREEKYNLFSNPSMKRNLNVKSWLFEEIWKWNIEKMKYNVILLHYVNLKKMTISNQQ